ncbi:periplasmic thioredoxin of cytochrome c-type biogenesis [Psychromonas aquatilis]|uniref:Periplasmic thioredoxin of cytochrome c-type biogenesis n=1 Tax=Psychromonas aquatilis TaxID=2005072 RepID=A0ABU9GMQ7_9GAMM
MATRNNCIIASELDKKVQSKQTFVLNIVANWCSDCTKQQESMPYFKNMLIEKEVAVYELVAQYEKGDFIDQRTKSLVEALGGHGYPRTILFVNGEAVSADNIEVIDKAELCALADNFLAML